MQDAGVGGNVSAGLAVASAASIGDSMAKFASTAASGGFEVSEEGGQALINVITAFQKWATDQSDKIQTISQVPRLGHSYAAREVAPFVQQVATDGQGFAVRFKELLQSLEQAKQGIRQAMENYRRTDEANQAAVRQSGDGTVSV